MKKIISFSDDIKNISLNTYEGRLLFAALVKISGESQTDKTPNEILSQVSKLANKMKSKSS